MLLLVGLAAVFEGAGLVLLLPVAEALFSDRSQPASGISGHVLEWLGKVGITTITAQLAVMGAAFLALVLIRAIILTRRDIALAQFAHGFVDDIRSEFFLLIARAEWPVIKRFRKAHLLDAVTTNIGRLAQTMHGLTRGTVVLAVCLAYLCAAFAISAVLGALLLGVVALGLVIALVWSRSSHALGERLNRANRGVMFETTRFLDGLKTAKALRAENELAKRFLDSIAETRAVQVTFVHQQSRHRNAIQVLAATAAVAVLLLGYGVAGLSGVELLVITAIVLRLAPMLVAAFGMVQSVAHALPAFAEIRRLEGEIIRANEALYSLPGSPRTGPAPAGPAVLELVRCAVEAADEGPVKPVLVEAEHILIEPGMLVHVTGPSGAGKSTLAELVAGLHLPSRGKVLHGSLSLNQATRQDWQRQVAFVPQESFIFDGSVRENLEWPMSGAGDELLWHALERAEAAEMVRGLPRQLDEPLQHGGARLSGGERQRLCLARALLPSPAILVLDEATSAMDPALETTIIGRLKAENGSRIVLIVSHSDNAAEYADLRVEVKKGVAHVVSQ